MGNISNINTQHSVGFVCKAVTQLSHSLYLLYLLGLQEVTGFSEIGFERVGLQLGLDGDSVFGVHLLFGGDLQVEINVKYAFTLTTKQIQDGFNRSYHLLCPY